MEKVNRKQLLRKAEKTEELCLVSSDDLICELDEYPPTLEGKYVDAVCVNIQKTSYGPWGTRLAFEFSVFEPDDYAGLTLPMYVRLGGWKGRPPVSSKLAKVAQVAGCQRRFTKSAFLNKAFRCRLKVTRGDARTALSK